MWWHDPHGKPDNADLWSKVWETISGNMTGLRTLRVYIRQFTWDVKPNAETERRVLDPLSRLRGLRDFQLWYRHIKVREAFGADFDQYYTFEIMVINSLPGHCE